MNRRNFIRGAAGLAALAVAGPTLARLSRTDRERLESLIEAGGTIRGQTFLLPDSGPIKISGIKNLLIEECNFIWQVPCAGVCIDAEHLSGNVVIRNSHFDTRGSLVQVTDLRLQS